MQLFNVGDLVACVNFNPLTGKSIAPPLSEGEIYRVGAITLDSAGNQHLDVGLKSEFNYITSFETGEELPNGDRIHWCHPSRFILSGITRSSL